MTLNLVELLVTGKVISLKHEKRVCNYVVNDVYNK